MARKPTLDYVAQASIHDGKKWMRERADVVIAGAGIIGSACAYYLTQTGFKGRILLIEKDLSFAYASTGRSAGGLRQQFSAEVNIRLSQFTLALLRRLKDEFGADADLGFKEQGYLVMASEKGMAVLERNNALQRALGADIHLLTPTDLQKRFPWITTQGVAGASFGASGEGWLDAHGLMGLLRKAARHNGAELIEGEVTAIHKSNNHITGVTLASGREVDCGHFINAGGPAAGSLAAMAGMDLPVAPRKRYVYVLDCQNPPESLPLAPLSVDPSGVWFRPEGRTFICGLSPEEHEEPKVQDFEVDHDFFDERIWPILAERVPAFEAINVVGSWAGHYDYNSLDQNGIIGAHPEVQNFYFANGFSGHGLQQGAGVGHAIAELIVKGRSETIDISSLGYERIAAGKPFFELNVI